MDLSYSQGERRKKRMLLPLFLAGVVLLIASGGILALSNRKELVSPLPEQPALEMIFYTPTPLPLSPTGSPSATPKTNIRSTATPKPTEKATPTSAVSPTPASSLTPTP